MGRKGGRRRADRESEREKDTKRENEEKEEGKGKEETKEGLRERIIGYRKKTRGDEEVGRGVGGGRGAVGEERREESLLTRSLGQDSLGVIISRLIEYDKFGN